MNLAVGCQEKEVAEYAVYIYSQRKPIYRNYTMEEALSMSIRELGGVYLSLAEQEVLTEKIKSSMGIKEENI